MASDAHFNTYRTVTTSKGSNTKAKKGKIASSLPTIQCVIPLGKFTAIATTIASSTEPKVRSPQRIVSLIRNVIGLRQQATDFFVKTAKLRSSGAIRAANAGRQHYVAVLEEVLQILQPTVKQQQAGGVAYTFEALSVEDTTNEVATSVLTAEQPAKAAVDSTEYELETTSRDLVFAIFSFFKDVNEIRDYLRGVRKDYREGRVDVMSAAVTTDEAFTLLKHSSEDIIEILPGRPSNPYTNMIAVLTTYLDRLDGAKEDFGD